MGTIRAAVVLFVDMPEDQCNDARGVAEFTRQGLAQLGILYGQGKNLEVKFQGQTKEVRIVDVMEAGMAAGNGYLWTEVTTKAYTQRGIYTDKQQEQLEWEQEHNGG